MLVRKNNINKRGHPQTRYNGYTWTVIMVTSKSKVGPNYRTYSMIKSKPQIKTTITLRCNVVVV